MKTIEERNKTIYKTDNENFLAVSNDVDKNRIVNFEMENIKKVSNDEKIELVYHIYFESAKKGLTPIFKNIDELNLEFKQNAKYVKDVNPIKFDGKIKLSDEVSFYTCIELPLINAVKELNDMGMTTLMSSANKIDVSKRNEPIKELTNHGNGEHFNLGNGYSWIMIDWESLSDENKRQFILMNNGSIPINLSDIALNNLKHNCEINKLPVLPKELISFYEVFDFRVFLQDSSLIGKLPTDKPEDFQFQKSRRGYGCVNSLCNHGKDYRTVVISYPLDENTTITEVEEYYRNIIKNLSRQDQVKHSL